MRYFPLFFDTRARTILVVGGEEEAAQKTRLLLKSEARIVIVAPELCDELMELERKQLITWFRGSFSPDQLEGVSLVYTTLDDHTNWKVARAAGRRNIPVNAVDMPGLCDVITPAIVDRDPVVVAIGTEGAAPVLARRIKSHLESWLPQRLGQVAENARKLRAHVARKFEDGKTRRVFWQRFWSGEVERLFLAGRSVTAWRKVKALLAQTDVTEGDKAGNMAGHVSLVGAGPGSADLLTFRAMQRLQEADVIVYDRLVDPAVLEVARRDAERIFVGKTPGKKCTRQDEINAILVREGSAGKRVVRLKSGDPMIFGRVAEEMDALVEAGVSHDIVPGVTAATACAAEAEIPLTLRKDVRAVTFLTGHCMNGPTPYDWSAVAQPGHMLAIYMGVKMAPTLRANLLAVGAPADSHVTIVERGCSDEARTFHTTLRDMTQTITCEAVQNPALIYVQLVAGRASDGEHTVARNRVAASG